MLMASITLLGFTNSAKGMLRQLQHRLVGGMMAKAPLFPWGTTAEECQKARGEPLPRVPVGTRLGCSLDHIPFLAVDQARFRTHYTLGLVMGGPLLWSDARLVGEGGVRRGEKVRSCQDFMDNVIGMKILLQTCDFHEFRQEDQGDYFGVGRRGTSSMQNPSAQTRD